jgi:phosphohistidine phosphatase
MPRLILFRHAKADRARAGEKDHERALSKHGRAEAEAAGRVLAKSGERPALVLCSTSRRTRETWDAARPALAGEPRPRFLRSLYEADGDYLPILREEGSGSSLMVIGHNPAIQVTALRLARDLGGADGAALAGGFPTAAIAVFDFEGEWSGLAPGGARLAAFLQPPDGNGE